MRGLETGAPLLLFGSFFYFATCDGRSKKIQDVIWSGRWPAASFRFGSFAAASVFRARRLTNGAPVIERDNCARSRRNRAGLCVARIKRAQAGCGVCGAPAISIPHGERANCGTFCANALVKKALRRQRRSVVGSNVGAWRAAGGGASVGRSFCGRPCTFPPTV